MNAGYFPVMAKGEEFARIFYRLGAGHLGDAGRVGLINIHLSSKETTRLFEFSAEHDLRNPSILISGNLGYLAALEYNVYSGLNGMAQPHTPKSILDLRFFRAADKTFENWNFCPEVTVRAPRKRLSPYQRILELADRWVMPVYGEGFASVLVSRDAGVSWQELHDIAYGYAEPALTVTKGGRLLAILRGLKKYVKNEGLSMSTSDDGGLTWSAPTLLVNGFAHPADILTTDQGLVVLTFGIRLPIYQAIATLTSADEGASWREPQPILIHQEVFRNCDFGYPSTIHLAGNKFATVFYSQPLPNMRFDFQDPARYDPTGTRLHWCEYEIASRLTPRRMPPLTQAPDNS